MASLANPETDNPNPERKPPTNMATTTSKTNRTVTSGKDQLILAGISPSFSSTPGAPRSCS